MERRALLAAVLCLLVLVVYQEAVQYLYPAPPAPPAVEPTPVGEPAPADEPPSAKPAPPEAAREPAAVEPPPAAAEGRQIEIDTELYRARLSTAGGRVVSFRLKHYRAAVERESGDLELIEVAPATSPPLGVRFVDQAGRVEDDTVVTYAVDREAIRLGAGEQATLRLTGTLPSGATIEKTLTFTGDGYPIEVEVAAPALAESFTRVGLGWRHQLVGAGVDQQAYYRGAVVLSGRKIVSETATALEGEAPRTYAGPVGWAGYADHYFLAAIVPPDPEQAQATIGSEARGVQVFVSAPRVAGGTRFTLYVGPKDVELLGEVGHDLDRAVDFGWFSFLALPLLRLLKTFHSVTGNYGLDIILLTILVKVLFIPLTNKSMKSMREMQRLQPQMAKLREKFKDDRERLNKEMIELYRRHRVNPLGGCLPMLLQFPVFIGLYQTLNQSIELRHAPFALWVRDLSTYECYPWPGATVLVGCNAFTILGMPIPVLVILMGGSMLLQQWLTPATGMDPTQQRMMLVLMPVMFTVMFVTFPSGLVLYWLVNNVLTIAQQWWTNRAPA